MMQMNIERVINATGSLLIWMAHMCGVMPAHAQLDQENSQDILMPAT